MFGKRKNQYISDDFENADILESLLTNFTSVYSVDFEKRTLRPYKQDDASKKRFNMFTKGVFSYDEAISYYLNAEVHPDDKEVVKNALDLTSVQKNLKAGKPVEEQYRVLCKGSLYFAKFRFVRFLNDDDCSRAVLLFRNITKEVDARQRVQQEIYENERIIEMLASEYESIYKLNITQHTFTAIRYPDYLHKFKDVIERGQNSFSIYEKWVKECVYPEDVDKMLAMTDVSNIRKALKDKNSFIMTFRDLSNGKLQHMELRVFKMAAGKDYILICGFINRDAENYLEVESKEMIKKDMICSLGTDYDCIGSVDFETNKAKVAHMSSDFAKLCGELEEIDDYNEFFKRISDRFVIPSDKEFYYEKCQKDEILKGLKENPSYFVTYRVRIEGKEYPYQAKFTYDQTDKSKVIVGFHKIV